VSYLEEMGYFMTALYYFFFVFILLLFFYIFILLALYCFFFFSSQVPSPPLPTPQIYNQEITTAIAAPWQNQQQLQKKIK
jgi:hypothetical protein